MPFQSILHQPRWFVWVRVWLCICVLVYVRWWGRRGIRISVCIKSYRVTLRSDWVAKWSRWFVSLPVSIKKNIINWRPYRIRPGTRKIHSWQDMSSIKSWTCVKLLKSSSHMSVSLWCNLNTKHQKHILVSIASSREPYFVCLNCHNKNQQPCRC